MRLGRMSTTATRRRRGLRQCHADSTRGDPRPCGPGAGRGHAAPPAALTPAKRSCSPPRRVPMDLKEEIARDLIEARKRTHELLAPLDEERLTTQHDQLMSPPVWDYAHIGVFEELWLVQNLSGAPPIDEDLQRTYNALE